MSAISRDHGDFYSPLPASLSQRPTPHSTLLQQRLNPNSTVLSTERSKPFFAFCGGQIGFNFWLVFSFLLFGRQRVATAQSRAAHQSPRLKLSS
jgi:hypothetical protein